MPKNVVLCCDGTNNQFDAYHTNVVRTYKVARRHPRQLTYYDPGVGTMPEPWEKTKIIGGIGDGLSERSINRATSSAMQGNHLSRSTILFYNA